jgi:hypothetical protein
MGLTADTDLHRPVVVVATHFTLRHRCLLSHLPGSPALERYPSKPAVNPPFQFGASAPIFGSGTTSTGRSEWCTTPLETLPQQRCPQPGVTAR